MKSYYHLTLISLIAFTASLSAQDVTDPFTIEMEERHEEMETYFEQETQEQDLWHRPYMTGDWFGYRDTLADNGLTFSGKYTGQFANNFRGGREQGSRYTGGLKFSAGLDMEKIANISGLQFFVSAGWNAGESLTQDKIGNTFEVTQLFGGRNVRLYTAFAEQSLLEDKLVLKAGRLSTIDDFQIVPSSWYFMNDGVNGALGFIAPISFSSSANWGGVVRMEPTSHNRIIVGAYNVNTRTKDNDAHGLSFTPHSTNGAVYLAEYNYIRNPEGEGDILPGTYGIGGFYASGKFDKFGNPNNQTRGNGGLYLTIEQMVYRPDSAKKDQGLTIFAIPTFAERESNKFPWSIVAGATYKGLLESRPDDVTGVHYSYYKFSKDLARQQVSNGNRPQNFESAVEVMHRVQLTPWAYVQPDFQYIINPGASAQYRDAFVAGIQFGLTF